MDLKLYYDGAIEGMREEGIRMAEEFIRGCENIVLGTSSPEGGVRLSILANLSGQQLSELYYVTGMNSQKVANLLRNPECEIIMTDNSGMLAVGGRIEFVTDPAVKKERWQPWMEEYFASPEDKQYALLRFITSYVRVMII